MKGIVYWHVEIVLTCGRADRYLGLLFLLFTGFTATSSTHTIIRASVVRLIASLPFYRFMMKFRFFQSLSTARHWF